MKTTPPSASLLNGQLWLDDNGVHINAHGGGILFHEGVYYWYGEHKIEGSIGNLGMVGVHVYSSPDLLHWTDAGIAFEVSDDPNSAVARGCVLERPKVIFNAKTSKFVMWFHIEAKDTGYASARSAVAISDTPTGPFTFLRSVRPDAGAWPINVTDEQRASLPAGQALAGTQFPGGVNDVVPTLPILARDFEGGQMARDMTLFVDDDGKAYHVFSSEENSTLHISLLSDDYCSHVGKYVRVFANRWHEAPALCKYQGRYWMITSGCTGYAPNAARASSAPSIWGPWEEHPNPCLGINPENGLGPEKTFGGQSTFIFPVHGKEDLFVAIFDLWRPDNAIDGRYAWLPMHFDGDQFSITWADEFRLP